MSNLRKHFRLCGLYGICWAFFVFQSAARGNTESSGFLTIKSYVSEREDRERRIKALLLKGDDLKVAREMRKAGMFFELRELNKVVKELREEGWARVFSAEFNIFVFDHYSSSQWSSLEDPLWLSHLWMESPKLARKWFSSLSQWEMSTIAKRLVPHLSLEAQLRSLELLLTRDLPEKALTRFNRYVIAHWKKPFSLKQQILERAVSRDSLRGRIEVLEAADELLQQGSRGFEVLSSALAKVEEPKGFRLKEKSPLGTGKHGKVYLVERLSDSSLWAWKVPTTDHPRHLESLKREFGKLQELKAQGLPVVEVLWPDGSQSTLLKTFVGGKSLRAVIASGEFADKKSKTHRALSSFLENLVRRKIYLKGLNSENILFNGVEWIIVDEVSVSEEDSSTDAFLSQKAEYPKKWTRDIPEFQQLLKDYFEKLEKEFIRTALIKKDDFVKPCFSFLSIRTYGDWEDSHLWD